MHTLDRGGLAPIHYAITNGMLDMVFQLVRLGGLCGSTMDMRCSPLLFALYLDRVDVVYMLLSEGADPCYSCRGGIASVHVAAALGKIKLLEEFFKVSGENAINVRDAQGRNPMHHAVEGGNISVLIFLLLHGGK